MARRLLLAAFLLWPAVLFAQVDGRQVIVSPDALREAEVAGSTNDALKVICVDGTCTGGGGGTQDVNIVEVGGNAVTTSVPVTCIGGCATAGVSTITDTLNVNGDTVTLELTGAAGASASFPAAGTFSGTVVFEVSNDGGASYRQVQANSRNDYEVSNDALADTAPSNREWVYALAGGETHVRVRVTAYTSGTVDVTITGAAVPSSPVQAAMFPSPGGNRPLASVMVGGQDISAGSARPPVVYNFNDATGSYGWIVRDMQGGFRVGQAMTGSLDFGKAIGGIFSDDTYQFAEIRDTTPGASDNGLVVRGAGNFVVTQPTGTNLHIVCDSGCGGASSFSDNSAFTFGTTAINVSGFVFDDVAPNAVTENNAAAPRMSGNRVPYSILRDAAGNERGANVTAGNALVVDGSASTQPVSAVNLDIRDLVFATDKVDVSGSAITATVSATDLDIRNLTFPTDKVDASGSTVHQGVGTLTIGDSWYVKISDGTDGPAEVVDLQQAVGPTTFAVLARAHITDAGGTAADVTAANALKVDGSAVTQPISGTVTANAGTNLNTSLLNLETTQVAVAASLSVLDDWDESDRAKVNPIVGQAGVQGAAGASTANTQRVAIATDANAVSVTYPAVTGNAPAASSVGVASASCLASNAARKGAFFKNTSNATISLAESGQAAVLNSGITLQPGDAYNMIPPFLTTGQVNCIASAAASNLSILEKQ